MKLCDGRSICNLPQYVYGIVVEGTVDLTDPKFLEFFEIEFTFLILPVGINLLVTSRYFSELIFKS